MVIRFFEQSLHEEYRDRTQAMLHDIRNSPDSAIDATDPIAFSEVIAAKHSLTDVPRIIADDVSRDEPAFAKGSSSLSVTVYIPFSGNHELFRFYNNSHVIPNPVYEVREGVIVHTLALSKNQTERLDDMVAEQVKTIEEGLQQLRHMVPKFNENLVQQARQEFDRRLYEINQNKEAAARISKSKIRVRKRDDGAEKVIVPLQRKSLPVPQQLPANKNSETAYWIQMAEYDDILATISSMVRVMERTPSVFAVMNEEPLRTILLVALNGLYEGQATGETFNGVGKTDILIRREDRNVFIGECLMWKGQAYLLKKMNDQLFQYAVWQDSKLALIIFNRGGNFTNTIETMKETIKNHPQCIRELPYDHQSGARYLFRRHDDPERHFTLTALAFDVPG